MINVFCENKGWLFEDLKSEIAKFGAVSSEYPLKDAKAWICIRSSEAYKIPDKSRALVQVHDVKNKTPEGYGLYSFVHDCQRRQSGLNGFVQPIGSRDIPYDDLPDKPTIGFFCREYGNLKRSRMFYDAVKLAKKECKFKVLMVGERLDHIMNCGQYIKRGAEPDDYSKIDALVTCSVSPMIPISVYEALSAGRVVISTPREWPFNTRMVKEGENEDDIAELIYEVVNDRGLHKPFTPYTRQSWAQRQYDEALKLCI